MELEKKSIYMNRPKNRTMVQVTVDEDRNVPDAKPDMGRIVMRRGTVEMDEVRCSGEKAQLHGRLQAAILYGTDTEKETLESLMATLPFEEQVSMPGVGDRDIILADWVMEDLTIEMVHSRKIRIQAVISVTLQADELSKEELICNVTCQEPVEKKMRSFTATQLAVQKKEIYRVREEVKLHGNKPNILELIWQDTHLGRCDVRPEENKVSLRGELAGFIMYRAEDEQMPVQWSEFTIPFEGEVTVDGCRPDMIPDIAIRMTHSDWETAEDEDGERRLLDMEAILELSIRLYMETEEEVVSDLYSPVKEAVLEEKESQLLRILTHNSSSCKVDEKVQLAEEARILQICYGTGEVLVDEVKVMEDGLQVEGALHIYLLYMSSDDSHPLQSVRRTIPVQYLVEARGVDKNCLYQVRPQLASLNFLMLGNDEAEVKAALNLETLILMPETSRLVTDVELVPYDEEKVRKEAGIVGYLVQPEDTLWKIAKRFYTTVERIYEVNPGLAGEPEPGTWLLLVKQTEELGLMPGRAM